MVEGARLESVYARKGIAGSNPALSATGLKVMYPVINYHYHYYNPKNSAKIRSATMNF